MLQSEKSAAVISLRLLETMVKVMCRNSPPDSITKLTALSKKAELNVISTAKDKFRTAVRAYLIKFASEISTEEKTQWEANMAATVRIAVVHKFGVLGKVNQLLLPPSVFETNGMSEYEIQLLKLRKKRSKLQEEHPHFHFSEKKDMRVQAMIHQDVPHQPGHVQGELQFLGSNL